jgi:anti-sigma factor RsiW
MAKLTPEMLLKYSDGELSDSRAATVKNLLESSPEDAEMIEEWARIGSLLRVMDEETTKNVSFDGLADKVLAEIKTTRISLSFFDKLKVWFTEFFEHRRSIWIPASVAVGAVCLAVTLLPAVLRTSGASSDSGDANIVLHSASTTEGSRIADVDFGTATGRKYAIDDGRGITVGVVWIVEQ